MLRFKDFAAKDLKEFSVYACVRTIPSIVDGLKVPQRKALYGAIHHGGQTTVARLANHAAEVTSFIHGEENMMDTIVRLAQDFPGSNNLPLLAKAGQFGVAWDKNYSQPRYIKASLHRENFDLLFSKEDEPLLKYLVQEEQQVEPLYYLPSVPLVLVNGASGVGVGYATTIMQHSLEDVRKAVEEVIRYGQVKTRLVPHLNGYRGEIRRLENDQVEIRGCLEVVDRTTIRITEVPPKYDRKKYREHLNSLISKDFDSKGTKWVRSYANETGDSRGGWYIVVKVPMAVTALPHEKLMDAFKLIERNTQNVVLWSTDGSLKTYPNVEAVVEEFVPFRLARYEERKKSTLAATQSTIYMNDLRIRFIRYWNEHSQALVKLSRKEWLEELCKVLECSATDCEKLLEMNIYSLTKERLEALVKANEKLYDSYRKLEQTTPAQIWAADLKKIK